MAQQSTLSAVIAELRHRCVFRVPAIYVGIAFVLLLGCQKPQGELNPSSSYIFVWANDEDSDDSDFLVVIDARPASPRYGRIITTLPVGYKDTKAHHTEHRMHESGVLFANGFKAGRTFRFDLTDPEKPKLLGSFGSRGAYTYPHSFERLPNGNVLATFQNKGEGNTEEGGLVELDPNGNFIRAVSASAQDVTNFIRPYSLAIVPELNRVVSTSADMRASDISRVVQVWNLTELSPIKTIYLSAESFGTAEPRVLQDGITVIFSTFTCDLYKINGLAGDNPSAELVYSFPFKENMLCALPVVSGEYWIQAVPSIPALVSLDISDSSNPVEVSRLEFENKELPDIDWPHWISLEPNGERIVVTGYRGLFNRLLIVNLNKQTGALSFDKAFREEGSEEIGINFAREIWPHGDTGSAIPHGSVFSLN